MPIPENVENLRRVSAKSSIYQVVCSWIITGVLKPGEKIVDSELAKRFNVSRTPVREAIQILEGQKLVYVVPGRATVVADIDPADIEKCYRTLSTLEEFSPWMAEASAWATWMRWSRRAWASPMEPSRSFSATFFFASLMALAAASLPRASM